jgi:hypothetical protein
VTLDTDNLYEMARGAFAGNRRVFNDRALQVNNGRKARRIMLTRGNERHDCENAAEAGRIIRVDKSDIYTAASRQSTIYGWKVKYL